jgi:hypothetical protein
MILDTISDCIFKGGNIVRSRLYPKSSVPNIFENDSDEQFVEVNDSVALTPVVKQLRKTSVSKSGELY